MILKQDTPTEFPGGPSVKDLVLSLLWLGFNPWPGNFGVLQGKAPQNQDTHTHTHTHTIIEQKLWCFIITTLKLPYNKGKDNDKIKKIKQLANVG